jgi:hypothetical protein
MSDIIDGSIDTPEGRRKLSVSQRPGESSEDFTTRMLAFMIGMEASQTLDVVLASAPGDWEILPSHRWLEARNRTYPRLRLRVTDLVGGSVGHLVVESGVEQVADDWGDLVDGQIYLPRAGNGRISTWKEKLWSLVHKIKELGDKYEVCLNGSGIVVE